MTVADIPEGYREIPPEDQKKAEAFFTRGATVAGTGNYDYAIEMYIQGLNMDPEATSAHQALRDISLKRKASGGKPIGMLAAMKMRGGKDEKENLLNGEKLLASDPGNTDHMVRILETAVSGGFYDTVMWIGAILLKANSDPSSKEDFSKYIKLKNAYMKVGRTSEANEAMKYAVKMRPDDADLVREARDIAATDAMKRGGYDKGGSFRDSVKDMGKQKELMDKDMDVRTMDVLALQINAAEQEWKAEQTEPGKLMKLLDLLAKTELPEYENRGIELLESAYERTKQFRWREASGKIEMNQLSRAERAKRMELANDPSNEAKKKDYQDFVRQRAERELVIFKEGSENYPTDMSKRYNLGVRMFQLGKYDECIPVFQQARNDPKFKVAATVAL